MKKHLLRIADLTKDEILAILDRAEELRQGSKPRRFPGTILGLLFFQASTRTRIGFHSAIARLGGTGITIEKTKYQPGMTHPESLEDTLRSIVHYCDAFVLRHPENDSIDRAARVLTGVPLLNAGNGLDEHPTQALIDLFAIRSWHHRLEGLRIGFVGDLARSRSTHSLLQALHYFPPAELRLMHPASAAAPPNILSSQLTDTLRTESDLRVQHLDVLYVAGFSQGDEAPHYDTAARQRFRLTTQVLPRLSGRCLILDPLPRIDEIDPLVDRSPNAYYFLQSTAGRFVRSAILELQLGMPSQTISCSS